MNIREFIWTLINLIFVLFAASHIIPDEIGLGIIIIIADCSWYFAGIITECLKIYEYKKGRK